MEALTANNRKRDCDGENVKFEALGDVLEGTWLQIQVRLDLLGLMEERPAPSISISDLRKRKTS